MEAVQGDIRTNVMQAPKLTLFNGQTATISVQDFQFFTIGVQVQNGGFGQLIYNPLTTLFPLGVQLTIQAVISGDRRFVRLSLTPSMTNLVNGEVPLFPVVTPIFPLFDGTATGQPVVFTQFVQQPRLTRVSVQTTVAVPDGGTVLMGGLKRLSEGRNEFGPPVLSKIPYLNRLFQQRRLRPRGGEPADHGDAAHHHPGGRGREADRLHAAGRGLPVIESNAECRMQNEE